VVETIVCLCYFQLNAFLFSTDEHELAAAAQFMHSEDPLKLANKFVSTSDKQPDVREKGTGTVMHLFQAYKYLSQDSQSSNDYDSLSLSKISN